MLKEHCRCSWSSIYSQRTLYSCINGFQGTTACLKDYFTFFPNRDAHVLTLVSAQADWRCWIGQLPFPQGGLCVCLHKEKHKKIPVAVFTAHCSVFKMCTILFLQNLYSIWKGKVSPQNQIPTDHHSWAHWWHLIGCIYGSSQQSLQQYKLISISREDLVHFLWAQPTFSVLWLILQMHAS